MYRYFLYITEISLMVWFMAEFKTGELVVAVRDSDKKAIKMLLSEGGNPNCRTDSGRTLLELALLNNDIETFRLLVDSGSNILARGREGYSMLYLSMLYGNIEAAKYLIEKGAKFWTKDDVGTGVLIKAIQRRDKGLVETLIGAGADVNSDAERTTPLIAAIDTGDLEMAKLLIGKG